jgi:hypothetical protein
MKMHLYHVRFLARVHRRVRVSENVPDVPLSRLNRVRTSLGNKKNVVQWSARVLMIPIMQLSDS